jgi:predicted AAA+ superfamily ATPase
MYLDRAMKDCWIEAGEQFPVLLLTGPRQVGKAPQLYYYRDRDDNEIDFLFRQDQVFYPVEVKKTASPRRELAQPFNALARLKQPIGEGAILCLCQQTVPLAQDVDAVPLGII